MKKLLVFGLLVVVLALAVGCSNNTTPTPAMQPVSVALEADDAILPAGGQTTIRCITSMEDEELDYLWLISGGKVSGEGATAEWVAPREAGDYTIAVEVSRGVSDVVANEEKYSASVVIVVRENRVPTISEIIIGQERFMPGGSYSFECLASDVNGDALTYEWQAEGGAISGEGPSATWIAPDTVGACRISVTAKDEMGGEATRFVSLDVEVNHAPEIDRMEVAAEHKYLKDDGDYYQVGEVQSYYIGCEASDSDGDSLIYVWSWDRGELEGSGPVVTWIAPRVSCEVRVTVTVLDGRGGAVSQEVVLDVVECTPCTFGS
ncbi:MAG: hypothetical protein J7K94_07230 [Dehalococcoidia bacterium]|nr:hypothetical protein [Dehalococcoidia bacterium]